MPTGGAAPAADDILILVACGEGDDEGTGISLSTANGFVSALAEQDGADDDALEENPENNCEVFWKRAVGGDSAPVVADSGDHTTCAIHNFSGVKTTGDPWNVTAGGDDSNANDTSGVIPGATTTVNNTLVVLVQGTSNNATATTNCGAVTNADLTSITERFDSSNTAGLGGGHCVITGEKASSGTYANSTLTMGATTFKAAFSIALEPANQPESFTEIWDLNNGINFAGSGHRLTNPMTASASIVVTLSTSVDEVTAGATALTGVDQTTPVGTHCTATSTSTSTSTVTCAADATDWLIDTSYGWGTTNTPGADQTARWEQENIAGATSGGGSTQLGSADDVMSWSGYGNAQWVIGALPVNEAAGGPTCAAGQNIALLGVGCR